jgi:hypothetical protein
MVVNHTSTVGRTHLVDTLLANGIAVKKYLRPNTVFGVKPTPANT